MHVDGNNQGPSYIIGFGDYTGGSLWVYEPDVPEEDCYELQVPCTMRGFPELKEGDMARGRIHSCKNKFFKFNGNTPHCTMPFDGERYTLVYFCRRKWETM